MTKGGGGVKNPEKFDDVFYECHLDMKSTRGKEVLAHGVSPALSRCCIVRSNKKLFAQKLHKIERFNHTQCYIKG